MSGVKLEEMEMDLSNSKRFQSVMMIDDLDARKELKTVVSFLLFGLEDYLKPYLNDVNGYVFCVSPELHYEKDHVSYSWSDEGEIEIIVNTNGKVFERQGLLKVMIDDSNKACYIPNIMVHESMRHKGVGKGMIRKCFDISSYFGYSLYVVQLVDSFLNRLLRRGAVQTGPDEVLITDKTDLEPHEI